MESKDHVAVSKRRQTLAVLFSAYRRAFVLQMSKKLLLVALMLACAVSSQGAQLTGPTSLTMEAMRGQLSLTFQASSEFRLSNVHTSYMQPGGMRCEPGFNMTSSGDFCDLMEHPRLSVSLQAGGEGQGLLMTPDDPVNSTYPNATVFVSISTPGDNGCTPW